VFSVLGSAALTMAQAAIKKVPQSVRVSKLDGFILISKALG
jgi:hypothetical protein